MDFFRKTKKNAGGGGGGDSSQLSAFFKKEDIKKLSKEIIKPVVNIIYDEIYPYIWFLCIYNVLFLFITLAILFLVIRFCNKNVGGGSNAYSVIV